MPLTHGVTCGKCGKRSIVCTPGEDFPCVGTRYRFICPKCATERHFASGEVTIEEDGCPEDSVEGKPI
jgi:hypothetical protein